RGNRTRLRPYVGTFRARHEGPTRVAEAGQRMTTREDAPPPVSTDPAASASVPDRRRLAPHARRGRRFACAGAAIAVAGVLVWLAYGSVSHGTLLSAHTDVRIEPGKNAIRCATSQIAWDRLAR